MDDGTIDLATFRSLEAAAGAEFVSELVTTFGEEAPQMLAAMRAALASRDADVFRRNAHSLKSNSLTFGANRLADLARSLEQSAVVTVATGDESPLNALAAEFSRVAEGLARLRHA